MVTPQVTCIPHFLEVAILCHSLRDLDKIFRELTHNLFYVYYFDHSNFGLDLNLRKKKTGSKHNHMDITGQ